MQSVISLTPSFLNPALGIVDVSSYTTEIENEKGLPNLYYTWQVPGLTCMTHWDRTSVRKYIPFFWWRQQSCRVARFFVTRIHTQDLLHENLKYAHAVEDTHAVENTLAVEDTHAVENTLAIEDTHAAEDTHAVETAPQ